MIQKLYVYVTVLLIPYWYIKNGYLIVDEFRYSMNYCHKGTTVLPTACSAAFLPPSESHL